jgi:hypothetical protein
MTAVPAEVVDLWASREWRLNNLYWIENKHGEVVKFKLNAAQQQLLDDLHYLNIVLKARQLGFSTFILLLALDCAVFNDHFAAGLVADTIDNAKNLLKRVKFAYERLPDEIKDVVPLDTDNATELELKNGSVIAVGVSLRSGTFNLIHVSEYGKICAKYPDKAKEIKSGALNTIAPKQLVFIESTAEGRGGDFYDKTTAAQAIADSERALGDLDYKFHFFPWFMDPTYATDDEFSLTPADREYFKSLFDEHGIELTDQQQWWYAAKSREQGDDMWKEFPSTPEEAFRAAKDGAYFAKSIRSLRQLKRIGQLEFEPRTPVNTFWDLGVSDSTAIWLHQLIAGRHRFVGYFENSGEGIGYYLDWLDKWRAARGARFDKHYGPHDVEHRIQGLRAESIKDIARSVGYEFQVVQRTPDKLHSIQNVRTKLPECEFDEAECEQGLIHLESYSREWDEKYGVWKSHPRHDEHSHGADAFMTFSDGFIPPAPKAPKFKARKVV